MRKLALSVFLASISASLGGFKHSVLSGSRATIISKPRTSAVAAFAVSDRIDAIVNQKQAVVHPPKPGKYALTDSPHDPAPDAYPRDLRHDMEAALAKRSGLPMPAPGVSFDGLSNYDNIAAYSAEIIPPDMIGDVGPNHYVQAVNALVRIFDKGGNAMTPPFRMSELFAPLGTPCSSHNDGEAIVIYDPLADRWLLSQYCTLFPPFRQMIAVSRTGDPAGAYYLYEFVMPNVRLNDVAKFGVWPDGYYMSTDEFIGSDFAGAGMFAFDRNKMLVGDPTARYVYFSRPSATAAAFR